MPLKRPEKSVTSKTILPPTSQIRGLGDLAKAPHEAVSGCRRKWIKETDSAYVRLAKQGGRPDLLKHDASVTMKTSSAVYAAPDWYTHCSKSPATDEPRSYVSSLPDYMIHREFKAGDHHGNNYETRRGPFDFDMKSIWQRDAEDKENTEKKKVKLPAINPKYPSRMPNVSTNKEFSGKNKLSFPPMSKSVAKFQLHRAQNEYCQPFLLTHSLCDFPKTKAVPAQRKNEAVNFSKLISNGYGTDWLQQCTGWEKKTQETSENSEQSKDSEPSQSESAPASNESKPQFQGHNNYVLYWPKHKRKGKDEMMMKLSGVKLLNGAGGEPGSLCLCSHNNGELQQKHNLPALRGTSNQSSGTNLNVPTEFKDGNVLLEFTLPQ